MTLKDFLAEAGQSPRRREQLNNVDSLSSSGSSPLPGLNLTKSQQRSLHEAMYYAAESGHLDIAVDLRNLGKIFDALLKAATSACVFMNGSEYNRFYILCFYLYRRGEIFLNWMQREERDDICRKLMKMSNL